MASANYDFMKSLVYQEYFLKKKKRLMIVYSRFPFTTNINSVGRKNTNVNIILTYKITAVL